MCGVIVTVVARIPWPLAEVVAAAAEPGPFRDLLPRHREPAVRTARTL
jgi:hypothetical protein